MLQSGWFHWMTYVGTGVGNPVLTGQRKRKLQGILNQKCISSKRLTLDHKSMFFAIMSHKNNVAIRSPDQPGQFECIVWARGGRLDRGHLVCFNAAELGCRIQHSNTSQERGVHLQLQKTESRLKSTSSFIYIKKAKGKQSLFSLSFYGKLVPILASASYTAAISHDLSLKFHLTHSNSDVI